MLRQTLVTIFPGHVPLASAFSRPSIASLIVDGSGYIAGTRLATVRIFSGEIPKSANASIASTSFNVGFAMATTSD